MDPNLHSTMLDIRSQLCAALARIDRILAGSTGTVDVNTMRYRVKPGGALNKEGRDEIRRRFEAGEADSVIARAMDITVQGVRKRRKDWQKTRD